MNRYTVKLERPVLKQLEGLAEEAYQRVKKAIADLSENPRPIGSKKLRGREGYRLRVGDYRIIYEINDKELIVLVVKVAHRKDIYRK